jgi:serine protease Do
MKGIVMHSTIVWAVLVAILMVGLPTAPPATAAGISDPQAIELVAKVLPSCVNIATTRYKRILIVHRESVLVQDPDPDKQRFSGSGFIISTDGLILTNKHVTRNGISYTVTFSDGRQLPADLIEEAVAFDIALLKIRSNETWTPVTLGDSDALRRGEPVIAIGNPLTYSSTVTTGVISAFNRDLGFTEFDDYLQTDAAINQGNSGGPLFNLKGEVIGVNSAIETTGTDTGNIGIGLAIPINDAKFLIKVLLTRAAGNTWHWAWMGATVQTLTPDLAAAYGLPGPWGSVVLAVGDGSPAAQAKLRKGDVIVSMDGKNLTDSRALMRAIVEAGAGETVKLGVWRDGRQDFIPVTLADMPAGWSLPIFLGGAGNPKPELPPEASVNFGLQLSEITPDLRAKYKIDPNQNGAVVTAVALGSEAANRLVDIGAVILAVRDAAVTSPEEVLKALDNERQQKRSFVPVLLSVPGGLRMVPFPLN